MTAGGLEAPQHLRDRAGEIIFETCFHCIFHHCVFNADPHPGNYLFGDEGEVTFLDFGCVKCFEPDMIDRWKRLAKTLLDGDRERFPDRFVEAGLVAKAKGFDWDAQWAVQPRAHSRNVQTVPFSSTALPVRGAGQR